MTTITTHRVIELVAQITEGPSQEKIGYLFILGNEWRPRQFSRPYFNLAPTREADLLEKTFHDGQALLILPLQPQHRFFILDIKGMRKLTSSETESYDMAYGLELNLSLGHENESTRIELVAWYDPHTRKGWLFRIIEE